MNSLKLKAIHSLDFIKVSRFGTGGNVVADSENGATNAQVLTALTSQHVDNRWEIEITFTTIEPILFLSPFLYGENNNNQAGIYGVKKFNVKLQFDTTAKRLFCTKKNREMELSLMEVKNSSIDCQWITPQPTDILAKLNVVPYTT